MVPDIADLFLEWHIVCFHDCSSVLQGVEKGLGIRDRADHLDASRLAEAFDPVSRFVVQVGLVDDTGCSSLEEVDEVDEPAQIMKAGLRGLGDDEDVVRAGE